MFYIIRISRFLLSVLSNIALLSPKIVLTLINNAYLINLTRLSTTWEQTLHFHSFILKRFHSKTKQQNKRIYTYLFNVCSCVQIVDIKELAYSHYRIYRYILAQVQTEISNDYRIESSTAKTHYFKRYSNIKKQYMSEYLKDS